MIERAVINAGPLVEAQRRGLISDVRPRLMTLRAAGYFIADNVIDAACGAVGE
jgi:predicted nucleic acid-binding protein